MVGPGITEQYQVGRLSVFADEGDEPLSEQQRQEIKNAEQERRQATADAAIALFDFSYWH